MNPAKAPRPCGWQPCGRIFAPTPAKSSTAAAAQRYCSRPCSDNANRVKAHAQTNATTAARLEDLTWMAATGETFENAATRLGISESNLSRFITRHDPALMERLLANGVHRIGRLPVGALTIRLKDTA